MRAWLESMLHKLAGLPGLRLIPWGNREWQKSTVQSTAFWLFATLLIFKLVSQLGHGVALNLTVSLTLEAVAFGVNKLWIWKKRDTTVKKSGGRNLLVWAVTTSINGLLAWQVISRVGVVPGRVMLGGYGIVMNPIMFRVRDRMVFGEQNFREVTTARCRLEMAKAMSASRMALMKFGGI